MARPPRYDLLEQLADFLEKLPPERFYYGHWVGRGWRGQPDLSCGTTACAFGWACTFLPGLQLAEPNPTEQRHGIRIIFLVTDEDETEARYSDLQTFAAASRYFGVSVEVAHWLFAPDVESPWSGYAWSPDRYASATEVARHIRYVLRILRSR